MTGTLLRCIKRALVATFEEAVERFGPERALLLYRQEGSNRIEVECSLGYNEKPTTDSQELKLPLVQSCFSQAETLRILEGERAFLCVSIRRPPDAPVVGVLYFENSPQKPSFQQDEIVSIEALAARTGAEMAILERRLLSKVQRVLPTSDLVDTWSGIRRAGLEAYGAGVNEMALSFLERAKDLAEAWGPCRELAGSLNDYGQVLVANERLDDAIEQFERGISILEQAGLDRHSQAIPLLNNLGGALHAKGNLVEAERLYRLGLDIMSEQKTENRATPAVMANLGVISAERGDPATARIWLQQAVSSSTRMFGEDHPNTMKCRAKLEEL